jgi:DNA-binding IscR family transcriptional regulator
LLELLEKNKKVSIKFFSESVNIPYRLASKIMIRLTLSNILNILPQEGGDDLFESNI